MERFLKILEISEEVLSKRESHERYRTKKKEQKMKQRKANLLRSLQMCAVENPDVNTTISPKDYVLFMDPSWAKATDANAILKSNQFALTIRIVHFTPMPPSRMEKLPGHSTNDGIGPNSILRLQSLQRIPHCTPDENANNDHRAWCGGLGFCMAYFFYFGHYHMHYHRGDGRTYYCYIVFPTSVDVLKNINQYHFGGHVHPRHIGLCEFPCNENQLKTGPFMKYDMCVSFKIPDDESPSSCKFTLLRIRDKQGDMHKVNLDLEQEHECLEATYRGVTYTPPKSEAEVIELE
jgi:hypothetical protein